MENNGCILASGFKLMYKSHWIISLFAHLRRVGGFILKLSIFKIFIYISFSLLDVVWPAVHITNSSDFLGENYSNFEAINMAAAPTAWNAFRLRAFYFSRYLSIKLTEIWKVYILLYVLIFEIQTSQPPAWSIRQGPFSFCGWSSVGIIICSMGLLCISIFLLNLNIIKLKYSSCYLFPRFCLQISLTKMTN